MYDRPTEDIVIERLDRFEMYRQTLSACEQEELDGMVWRVHMILRENGCRNLGTRSAKELLMALVDHLEKYHCTEVESPAAVYVSAYR